MKCALCDQPNDPDSGLWLNETTKVHVDCARDQARSRAEGLHRLFGFPETAAASKKFRCPFHDDETPSFVISSKQGYERFRCFGCGVSGDVIDAIILLSNQQQTFKDVVVGLIDATLRLPKPEPRLIQQKLLPPLSPELARRYYKNLVDSDQAQQWWFSQGITWEAIRHFGLGYCHRCPTYFIPEDPDYTSASYTIPIIFGTERDHRVIKNIRHRIAAPLNAKDKYRPERKEDGSFLWGADTAQGQRAIAIVEGEKKRIAAWQHLPWLPTVTVTSGATCWSGKSWIAWKDVFDYADDVFIILDPGAEDLSEQVAIELGGRRGKPIFLPEKLDDMLMQGGIEEVEQAIFFAKPYQPRSQFTIPRAYLPWKQHV